MKDIQKNESFLTKRLKGLVLLEYPAAFLEYIQTIPEGQNKSVTKKGIPEQEPKIIFQTGKHEM
jgi:hypothetical protein